MKSLEELMSSYYGTAPTVPTVDTSASQKLLDQVIARYQPGGEFGKPELALLERAKTKSLAKTSQGLVSAGLANTTVGASAGSKWEEEIGMPARLQLEDTRSQRLVEALIAKSNLLTQTSMANYQSALADYNRKAGMTFTGKVGESPSQQKSVSGSVAGGGTSAGGSKDTAKGEETSQGSGVGSAPSLGGGDAVAPGVSVGGQTLPAGSQGWDPYKYQSGGTFIVGTPAYDAYMKWRAANPNLSSNAKTLNLTPTLEDLIPSLKPPTPMQSFAQTASTWLG